MNKGEIYVSLSPNLKLQRTYVYLESGSQSLLDILLFYPLGLKQMEACGLVPISRFVCGSFWRAEHKSLPSSPTGVSSVLPCVVGCYLDDSDPHAFALLNQPSGLEPRSEHVPGVPSDRFGGVRKSGAGWEQGDRAAQNLWRPKQMGHCSRWFGS